ncbi:MAG: SH3 domain-containing protein [Pseudobdellovibrio sp.]
MNVKFTLFLFLFCYSSLLWASQKAIVNTSESDVYMEADFDSEIVDSVHKGESYIISDKTYGAFYKIKLKSGKVGYIADHEVDVNGKPFETKPFQDQLGLDTKNKKNSKNKKDKDNYPDDEEEEPFDFNRQGVTLQLINYHEDTMGLVQVDDLVAIGYKSISDASWEIMAAFKAPKYYAEKINGSVQGFNFWADYGINNTVSISKHSAFRYSGSFMGHFSQTKVTSTSRSYDLQDMTIGIVLEGGFMMQFKKITFDLSAKYFFDRNNYGGIGLSLLF